MSAALNVQRLLRCLVVSSPISAAVAVSLPLLPLMLLLLLQQVVLTEMLSLSTVATGPPLVVAAAVDDAGPAVAAAFDDAPFAKNSVVRGSNEVPRASLDLNCYGQTNTNMRVFWILFNVLESLRGGNHRRTQPMSREPCGDRERMSALSCLKP